MKFELFNNGCSHGVLSIDWLHQNTCFYYKLQKEHFSLVFYGNRLVQIQMKTLKKFVLECDIFSHASLQRYKEQESYRTLAGGVVSIVLIFFFAIVFANLILNTFRKTIINSTYSRIYHQDPKYGQLTVDPAKNYMFAVGINGIDLSSSQRYFDIVFTNMTHIRNGSSIDYAAQRIPLNPCTIQQWGGVTDAISRSYTNLAFHQWLCPPTGTSFSIQGKYSSQIFRYGQILISKCTESDLFPNTTCKNSTEINDFLDSRSQFTFNFYYINQVVNPQSSKYITYYLQDCNYLAFDTINGVSASLFYNGFSVKTDATLFPWNQYETITGYLAPQAAQGQIFKINKSQNQYFRFYLRKAADQFEYTRSFQKLDQTFSYIGGLFGTIVLLLLFLRLYSKYSYELDIGDKIFKQNNGGSFGSQNFNFVVFIGYTIYLIVSKLGFGLHWKTMKRYHECRVQCQKQLSVDLLIQKLTHFEQIAKTLLQQHHLKMLMIVPKPTIKQVKITRKRYLMKSIVYHQLQRKGRDILVDQTQYKKRLSEFLREKEQKSIDQMLEGPESTLCSLKGLQQEMATSFKKLQSNHIQDKISVSKKIKDRLSVDQMATIHIDIKPSISGFSMNHQNDYQQQAQGDTCKQISIEPLMPNYEDGRSQQQMKLKIIASARKNRSNKKQIEPQ